jgi:ABC-type dipeptide/oligopeptide/nickel transport system permease subunit
MGRDVWSRLVWGARASMLVGCLGLLLGGAVGVCIGMASGIVMAANFLGDSLRDRLDPTLRGKV